MKIRLCKSHLHEYSDIFVVPASSLILRALRGPHCLFIKYPHAVSAKIQQDIARERENKRHTAITTKYTHMKCVPAAVDWTAAYPVEVFYLRIRNKSWNLEMSCIDFQPPLIVLCRVYRKPNNIRLLGHSLVICLCLLLLLLLLCLYPVLFGFVRANMKPAAQLICGFFPNSVAFLFVAFAVEL